MTRSLPDRLGRRSGLAAALTLLLLVGAMAGPAIADHAGPQYGAAVAPTFEPKNPNCGTVNGTGIIEFKVEPVTEGAHRFNAEGEKDPAGSVTVNITEKTLPPANGTNGGPGFDYTVTGAIIHYVLVKGGSDANLYDYRPNARVDDVDLHAPVNHNNNTFYGLSHISFCGDPVEPATKSGQKFHDLNGNGVKDDGEPGLADWTIHLFNGGIHEHTTTDANGNYEFIVPPGTYTVCEELQAGWFQSFPAAGADCSGHDHLGSPGAVGYEVTLGSGEVDDGNDFGNFEQATKSGVKFNDLNADGVKDAGEPGLSGWEIRAYDAANDIADSDTTDANGAYELNLDPGSYTICEVLQAGWLQSHPSGNTLCEDLGIAGLGAAGYAITVGSGDERTDNDFGNFQAATKSGQKFHDLNGDGVKDAGEPGLSGWTIHLFNDDVHLHEVTDGDGNYSFSVPPGTYTVCEELQTGWLQSFPATGADCSGHTHDGVTPGAVGYQVTLSSGEVDDGNDFGNFRNATKSGTKFNDLEGDGVIDETDPPIEGWAIHLFGTSGMGQDIHQHTTTDADGKYSFNVPPGTYTVCEEDRGGWTQTFPAAGEDCTGHNGSAPIGYAIVLTSGQVDDGNDFANHQDPGEGCTPGYWKNHTGQWQGYSPNQTVMSVFFASVAHVPATDTLLQALDYPGGPGLSGGARILLRAGVAAVLNAAHDDVNYPRTEQEVIDAVNSALMSMNRATMLALASELDEDNNKGCPLN